MRCSRTISFAQATYNKCLRTTDCSLVCSLEHESHTAPFMLSIHSPDNIFMVLVSQEYFSYIMYSWVSIFISNRYHFCVLCFRIPLSSASASTRNHRFMTYWNIEHKLYAKDVRTYCRTTPSLFLGTLVPRQKVCWTVLRYHPYLAFHSTVPASRYIFSVFFPSFVCVIL